MRQAGALVLAAALAACGVGEQGNDEADRAGGAQAADRVRCAIAGADIAPICSREISQGPDGEVWVIRHPDGAFRRFVLIDGGARIATADGAEEVQADRTGADLEVRVAGNRYLFPAAAESKTGTSDVPAS